MKNSQTISERYHEKGPVEYTGNPFEVVWAEQIKLMQAYKDAGRLSEWPVALQPKENQKFYRELLGFLEEEIIEASWEAHELLNLAKSNQSTHEKLVMLNEEIADSLHFWVEVFIYLGLVVRDFQEYYAAMHDRFYLNKREGDILELAFQFAISWGNKNIKLDPSLCFSLAAMPECYEMAGRLIGPDVLEAYEKYTFKSVQAIQLAKNCLKSKQWKGREYEVNVEKFNEFLMEGWLNWILSLSILRLRPLALTQNYLQKNRINHDKIKTH